MELDLQTYEQITNALSIDYSPISEPASLPSPQLVTENEDSNVSSIELIGNNIPPTTQYNYNYQIPVESHSHSELSLQQDSSFQHHFYPAQNMNQQIYYPQQYQLPNYQQYHSEEQIKRTHYYNAEPQHIFQQQFEYLPHQQSVQQAPNMIINQQSFSNKTSTLNKSIEELENVGIEQSKKRRRTVFTITQVERLEAEFKLDSTIKPPRRKLLAKELNITQCQLKTWFQNRRMKFKRKRQAVLANSVQNYKPYAKEMEADEILFKLDHIKQIVSPRIQEDPNHHSAVPITSSILYTDVINNIDNTCDIIETIPEDSNHHRVAPILSPNPYINNVIDNIDNAQDCKIIETSHHWVSPIQNSVLYIDDVLHNIENTLSCEIIETKQEDSNHHRVAPIQRTVPYIDVVLHNTENTEACEISETILEDSNHHRIGPIQRSVPYIDDVLHNTENTEACEISEIIPEDSNHHRVGPIQSSVPYIDDVLHNTENTEDCEISETIPEESNRHRVGPIQSSVPYIDDVIDNTDKTHACEIKFSTSVQRQHKSLSGGGSTYRIQRPYNETLQFMKNQRVPAGYNGGMSRNQQPSTKNVKLMFEMSEYIDLS